MAAIKRWLLVGCAVMLLAIPAVGAQDVTGGDIETVASSVVMIETIVGRRIIGSGTGTIISPDGLIYTNKHVIEDERGRGVGDEFAISLLDDIGDKPDHRYYASLRYVSDNLDFAVLQIDSDERGNPVNALDEALPYLPPKPQAEVSVGDRLRIFGYPGIGDGYMVVTTGDVVTVQNGTISGVRLPVWYRTDAEISGGNSGGLAVNEAGEFIGLPTWVVSEDRTAGRLGGILPIAAVQQSLEAIALDEAPPSDGGSSGDGGSSPFGNPATVGTLSVVNGSRENVCSAYISPTTATAWGDDQLDGSTIPIGGQYMWELTSGSYDLLLIDCAGRELEDFRNIAVSGTTVFTFIPGASTFVSSGEGSPSGGGDTPPQTPNVATLTVENRATQSICYVYFTVVTANNWGPDRLDTTEIIRTGDNRSWDIPAGNYDIMLQNCDRNVLAERRAVTVTGDVLITYP
jgi:S1-C subfamily serine protease